MYGVEAARLSVIGQKACRMAAGSPLASARGDLAQAAERAVEERAVGRRDRLPGRGERRARRLEEVAEGRHHRGIGDDDDDRADDQARQHGQERNQHGLQG